MFGEKDDSVHIDRLIRNHKWQRIYGKKDTLWWTSLFENAETL